MFDLLSINPETIVSSALGDFDRNEEVLAPGISALVSAHVNYGALVSYVRLTPSSEQIRLRLGCAVLGAHSSWRQRRTTILRVRRGAADYLLCLPTEARLVSYDPARRISEDHRTSLQMECTPTGATTIVLEPSAIAADLLVFGFLLVRDRTAQFFQDLAELGPAETESYQLSNWFYARTPFDLWRYLIDGYIYDPRVNPNIRKRFRCQQCAYAWWKYFDYLTHKTRKHLYKILRDEIARSVLAHMSTEDGIHHGFWSNDLECHARFHFSGLHLLLSQYEITRQARWLNAAHRGLDYAVKNLSEELDNDGLWFLHDSKEKDIQPHKIHTTHFGKSIYNTGTLNTHIFALTVLHRLMTTCPSLEVYTRLYQRALTSLMLVLASRPASLLYRPMIYLAEQNQRSPSDIAGLQRYFSHLSTPSIRPAVRATYWHLRRLFPRVVMPNGFIERDLTLSFYAQKYHVINVKDLLVLYELTGLPWLPPIIRAGVAAGRKIDLENSVKRSPYFLEWMDVLRLYDSLIAPVSHTEMEHVKRLMKGITGSYSLDFFAHGPLRI